MNDFKPWKVMHIHLNEGVPALFPDVNYEKIYAVFWWDGVPLGHREISTAQLPVSAAQLTNLALQTITPAVSARIFSGSLKVRRKKVVPDFQELIAVSRPLSGLKKGRLSQPVEGTTSIVICTRERPDSLARCLKSIQKLSHPPDEILVVDNAPDSGVVNQLVSRMPGIRYVPEPGPGLSRARNAGIRCSTGDIIIFTDDDVEVHPDWLTRLLQNFDDPNVMAVTGLVLPAELETEAQMIFEKILGYLNKGYIPKTFDTRFFEETKSAGVPVWEIGAGANMAFRRAVFGSAGEFDERLGAGASGCSEDSELWYRILAEGGLCCYEPAAVVYHYHRRDIDGLRKQIYQYYRGFVTALLCQFARYRHWGNLRRLFITLPVYYKYMNRQFSRIKSLDGILSAVVAGSVAGIKFYLQNSGDKGPE
jgi:GT2 family glycosyltransferase